MAKPEMAGADALDLLRSHHQAKLAVTLGLHRLDEGLRVLPQRPNSVGVGMSVASTMVNERNGLGVQPFWSTVRHFGERLFLFLVMQILRSSMFG